jgi:hypothetical protein
VNGTRNLISFPLVLTPVGCKYPIVQTENAISANLSRKISTVRGPSRWFNADHDRGQILSFSSPSRIHRAQWANAFYKPTCTKYLGRIKFALKNKCKCGHFYCMWDLIRNYAYLWSDKVVKKGHILSLISSAVLSYLILHKVHMYLNARVSTTWRLSSPVNQH